MPQPPTSKASLVTLVPQSGLQFLTADLDLGGIDIPGLTFREPPDQAPSTLTLMTPAEVSAARANGGALPPDAYTVRADAALALFERQWVPLPYFEIAAVDMAGKPSFKRGPANWARLRYERAADGSLELLLAFDTAFTPLGPGGISLGLEAREGEPEFALCADFPALQWFLEERWVDGWVDEIYVAARSAELERAFTPRDRRHPSHHRTLYFALLDALVRSNALPRIRLVDIVAKDLPYQPVDVALVLDIGNARTCGVLVESHGGRGASGSIDLSQSYPLRLRDLNDPRRTYSEPFESRVEFARAAFGSERWSRVSGRSVAFTWPSPVRVGPEAVRLSSFSPGNSGPTGLSSPKRYLWDSQTAKHVWRFNVPQAAAQTEPPVSGTFMRYLREDGELIDQETSGVSAPRALFSRSSFFMFMLVELLLQAISQINAPDTRADREPANLPRRLQSLILTMPPAMPLAEQRLLRRRADAAVRIVWSLMGWTEADRNAPRLPRVVANLDEATATQLIYLYTEITQRLGGNVAAFLSIYGRKREGAAPSIRIASIDIGGGTTDLMVCTYSLEPGDTIVPTPVFREGFKIAGDDLLRETIETIVIPRIRLALSAAGLPDPREFLRDFFTGNRGETAIVQFLRLQVVARILEPVATAVLGADERLDEDQRGEMLRGKIRDLLGAEPAARAIAHFDEAAHNAGAKPGFTLADVEIIASVNDVNNAVRVVLGDPLADLCEAAHSLDCDWLLLSGRPSRLRAVREIVLARLPVPVHRIVQMHAYEVGDWYPFRSASGRISDPKTTAAVGAMLATLSEGRLQGFFLQSSKLTMRSTARYLGELNDNRLLPDRILIEQLDLDAAGPQREVLKSFRFQKPTFLGFKQLPLRRWPATPLYFLTWSNPDAIPSYKLPLVVTLRRDEIDREETEFSDPESRRQRELRREDLVIDRVEDAARDELPPSILSFRLQTMTAERYWRDTGSLTVEKA